MTFTIKHRGSGGPMIAEYECPVHGRFEATVQRDEAGDPPVDVVCPDINDDGVICSQVSPWRISAPRVRVRVIEVVRGGYQKPERETWTNTENLGEGQSLEDWRADRAKVWERDRESEVMALKKELG